MTPKRSDEILSEWSAVSRTATPPGAPPHARTASVAGPGISLAGAAALVVAVLVAIVWLGNGDATGPGAVSSPTPAPSVEATPAPAIPAPPTPEPSQVAAATPLPSPSSTPELAACTGRALVPQITMWGGAAGSRVADVQLTNTSDSACLISTVNRVQLVDGDGTVLVDGRIP